jgi:hypothetical protein
VIFVHVALEGLLVVECETALFAGYLQRKKVIFLDMFFIKIK